MTVCLTVCPYFRGVMFLFCFRNVKELLFRAGILRQKRKRTAGQAVLKKSALYKERTGVPAVPIFLMYLSEAAR